MNTVNLKLGVKEALESSLSFLAYFLKQHWLLAIVYALVGVLPAFIIGEQDILDIPLAKRAGLGLITIANAIVGLLFIYYSLRESLTKIDPTNSMPDKSIPFAIWQIFCMNLLSTIIGVPLLILFVLPGIWWSTKATVSFANLLGTSDGVIASIRKSHQLMNGRFWECFGFLIGTSSAIVLVTLIATITIGFFLAIGGILNAIFHEGSGLSKLMLIFRIVGPIFAVFTTTVFYYIQAWLYVYLKSQDGAEKMVVLPSAT